MDFWWTATFALSIFCALVGFIGNLFTLVAFAKFPKFRNSIGAFILSLTIGDVIASIMIIPLHLPFFYHSGHWKIGLEMCKLAKILSFGCFATSGITIALIAINRCVRISFSITTYLNVYTSRNVAIMLTLNWIFPFLLIILTSLGIGGHIYLDEENELCCLEGRECWSFLMIIYGAVLFTIVVCYSFIYYTVRKARLNVRRSTQNLRNKGSGSSTRLLNMLLTTTIMFVICFSPGPVIGSILGKGNSQLSLSVLNFFYYSAYYVSVFINPIIYGLLNAEYRNAYRAIFCQIFRIKTKQTACKRQSSTTGF